MTPAPAGGWRIDRRTFLKALGLSGVGLAAGASLGPWSRSLLAAEAPTLDPIDELALALEFDTERIFRFVAEHIRYEPYAGALRGAQGTLMARAGNSADQAVLLAALLRASGVDCRFARGPLDSATADLLLASTVTDVETVQQAFAEVLTGSGEGGRPIVTPEPDPRTAALLEEAASRSDETLAWANERLLSMASTVEIALASAGISLPAGFATLPPLETDGHVWVQAAIGPQWFDLDPSIPDAGTGEPFSTATTVHDTLPDELRHRLRFDVIAETVAGGTVAESSILQVEDFADALANLSIGVLNIEREGLKALGATIISGLEGGTTYVPCLVVGDAVLVGSGAIRFGGTDGGPFDVVAAGTPGPQEGEPTAQWLQVTIASPGRVERVVRRPIFDRLGPAARTMGPLDLSALEPAPLVQVRPDRLPDYMPARRTHWLTVHTGPFGGRALGDALGRPDKASALASLPRGFQLYREAGGIELGLPAGVRTFVDGPDIVSVTIDQELVAEATVENHLAMDIWHRSLAARPLADTGAAVDPAVLAGVLPHLIERLMVGEAHADAVDRPVASVGAVFDAAAREGIGTLVLRGSDEVDALPFPQDALARLRAAVTSGLVAIVPERPPDGPGGRVGWWLVDPSTGRTADEMDDGRGTVDQYAATVRVTVVETAGPMYDLGYCASIILLITGQALINVGLAGGAMVAAGQGQGLAAGLLAAAAVGGSGVVGGLVSSELAAAVC